MCMCEGGWGAGAGCEGGRGSGCREGKNSGRYDVEKVPLGFLKQILEIRIQTSNVTIRRIGKVFRYKLQEKSEFFGIGMKYSRTSVARTPLGP